MGRFFFTILMKRTYNWTKQSNGGVCNEFVSGFSSAP